MTTRYDIAIVGNGPGGLSAALNASMRNKNVIVLGPETHSEKLLKTSLIDNYLGLSGVSGKEMIDAFRRHVETKENITQRFVFVETVYAMGDYFGISLRNGEMVEAQKVILATGISLGKPIPGEEEYLGKGVGTCATCDAALYRDKKVVVIGMNEESVSEVNFISEIAAQTWFVNGLKKDVTLREGIVEVKDRPISIEGDEKAKRLVLKDQIIEADGFFVIRDALKPSQLVPGLEVQETYVEVDKNGETHIPGLYAVGDMTGRPYQVSKACGEGQIAALHASGAY